MTEEARQCMAYCVVFVVRTQCILKVILDSARPRDRAERLLPGHRMQDISFAQNSIAWYTSVEQGHDDVRIELMLAFFARLDFVFHFCLTKEICLFYTY